MKVIFIIGSHRTGTKLFANFFKDNFENVISHHQPGRLRFINIVTSMYLERILPFKVFENLIKMLAVNPIKNQKTEVYIESSGFNYIAAAVVKKYLANVKIIHIIRDPRDFVVSYMNLAKERTKSKIAHTLIPFWNITGYRTGEITKSKWLAMDKFEKYCWVWRYKNEKIVDIYSKYSDAFISFRFEDIINTSYRSDTIKKMMEFLGLSYNKAMDQYFNIKQNATKGIYLSSWKSWDSDQCRKLDRICRPLMKKYDYGSEESWEKNL